MFAQAPPHLRGTLSQLWQLVLAGGFLVSQLVNVGTDKIEGGWGWRLSLGLGALPAIALILGGLIMPDTPNSLIERGQLEEVSQVYMCSLTNLAEKHSVLMHAPMTMSSTFPPVGSPRPQADPRV